ncbi:MAG: acetyl-CoA carboxylase biotin carboxyl carrier protein subunit [Bdellovibrionales bacterium]
MKNKISLPIADIQIELDAVKSSDGIWVHYKGRTFFEPVKNPKRRGARGATTDSGEVLAPMPGKIIKLVANIGDLVKEGQLVVVMEAMKMEYSLKAPKAGKIDTINLEIGQQVSLGDSLFKISEE